MDAFAQVSAGGPRKDGICASSCVVQLCGRASSFSETVRKVVVHVGHTEEDNTM